MNQIIPFRHLWTMIVAILAAAEVWLTEVFMPGALGTFEQGFSGGKGAYIRGPQDRMGGGGGGAYYYQNTGVYGTGGSHAKGAAEAGIAFTGSGGGGSGLTNLGTLPGSAGAGGSGVVIIRYKSR